MRSNSTTGRSFSITEAQKSMPETEAKMQAYVKHLFSSNQKINLKNYPCNIHELPPYIALIIAIYCSLLEACCPIEFFSLLQRKNDEFKCFLKIEMKIQLLVSILQLISKRCYLVNQEYFYEISYCSFFKHNLIPYFIALTSKSNNSIRIQQIIECLNQIKEAKGHSQANNLYYLYGGNLFTIEAKTFQSRLLETVYKTGKMLTKEQNFITRRLSQFKSQQMKKVVFEQAPVIASLAEDREKLVVMVNATTQAIFQDQKYLCRQQFLNLVLKQSKNIILCFYIRLLRVQLGVMSRLQFQTKKITESNINTSFYVSEMQKIFKKCPFNGQNNCDCKKCQCVRRNRESAKLSQERKRNAVQQLQKMKDKIQLLEKRNIELKNQNDVLREVLKKVNEEHGGKEILRTVYEPITKMIHEFERDQE